MRLQDWRKIRPTSEAIICQRWQQQNTRPICNFLTHWQQAWNKVVICKFTDIITIWEMSNIFILRGVRVIYARIVRSNILLSRLLGHKVGSNTVIACVHGNFGNVRLVSCFLCNFIIIISYIKFKVVHGWFGTSNFVLCVLLILSIFNNIFLANIPYKHSNATFYWSVTYYNASRNTFRLSNPQINPVNMVKLWRLIK
jgi:hypothetical protein